MLVSTAAVFTVAGTLSIDTLSSIPCLYTAFVFVCGAAGIVLVYVVLILVASYKLRAVVDGEYMFRPVAVVEAL